jgi:hypothetical protein
MRPAVTVASSMLAALGLLLVTASAPETSVRSVAESADSPVREPMEIVVRSQAAWQAVWWRLSPGSEAPSVDFSSEMLVGIVASRWSTGLRLEVLRVSHEGGAVVIRYRVSRSTVAHQRDDAQTHPYQVVAIPRDRRRVRFLEVLEPPVSLKD